VSHAANHISAWIKKNIISPILIGPDAESEQWVSEVAKMPTLPNIDKN
jgi:ribose-phosphate pyrophosphokinase